MPSFEPNRPDTSRGTAPHDGIRARLRRVTGIDFHILVTLLFRGWTIAAGGLMIFLIPLWLTKVEQGYYYTFASLLALSVFFELGVNQVVTQVVAHEFAHLRLDSDGRIVGPVLHLGRLASVTRLLTRWYAVAAMLFILVVGPAGAVFFSRGDASPETHWTFTWWLMVAFTAANLFFSPRLAVIEGCGQVGQVARLRLAQSMAGYLLLWSGLAAGAGLWMVPAVPAVAALMTAGWLLRSRHLLRALSATGPFEPAHAIHWRTEILPFQWRIAISWISGYFIFQLFTPLVFRTQGAVAAGRLGIAISMFSAIASLGLSWVAAKLPAFAAHIARGERQALDALFMQITSRSIAFTAALSCVVVGVVAGLRACSPALVDRLAETPVLACLALATTANTLTSALAVYMRAHKREPMLAQSVTVAVLVTLATFVGARHGVFEMMLGYALIVTCIATPWAMLLYLPFRRQSA